MSQASLSPTFSPEKTEYQAQLLQNRLTKRFQHLKKWARRSDVGCYRLYDKDIPEIPLAIDIFFMNKIQPFTEIIILFHAPLLYVNFNSIIQ